MTGAALGMLSVALQAWVFAAVGNVNVTLEGIVLPGPFDYVSTFWLHGPPHVSVSGHYHPKATLPAQPRDVLVFESEVLRQPLRLLYVTHITVG